MTIPVVKFKFRFINIIVVALFLAMMSIMLMISVFHMHVVAQFVRSFNYLYPILLIISIISFLTVPLIYKNYNIIGSLKIENSTIKLYENNQLIKDYIITDIVQIIIKTNDTANSGGYGVRLGINNWISIVDNNNKLVKYRLFIANQSVLSFLHKQLNLMSKDIKVLKG